MHPIRFRSMARSPVTASISATLLLYACSLKNFDYLQEGGASEGGAIGTGGGQSESGGSDATGGMSGGRGGTGGAKSGGGSGGVSGGAKSTGGAAGNAGEGDAGSAGEGGNAGAGGQGGVGGDTIGGGGAGGSAGGVSSGGTSTGGVGGTGGTSSGGTGGGSVGQLVNSSFEQYVPALSKIPGWTVDPATAITSKYVWEQYPVNGNKAHDGLVELATWHGTDTYALDIYQNVTSLENGTYTLKAWISSERSQEAYLFARNCGGTEKRQAIITNAFPYFEVVLSGIEVTAGSCEVGLHVSAVANDYLNADMFTFEKDP